MPGISRKSAKAKEKKKYSKIFEIIGPTDEISLRTII